MNTVTKETHAQYVDLPIFINIKRKSIVIEHLKKSNNTMKEKPRRTEEILTLEKRRWLDEQTRTYTLKNNIRIKKF